MMKKLIIHWMILDFNFSSVTSKYPVTKLSSAISLYIIRNPTMMTPIEKTSNLGFMHCGISNVLFC